MKWLEQRGLKQWDGYFDCYPRSYFEAGAARGDFYLLKEGTAIVAVLLYLSATDAGMTTHGIFMLIIWQRFRDTPASGRTCFAAPEALGRRRGKLGIRCDSDVHDARLGDYYEALGYSACGAFREGAYEGMRRVKFFGS